MMQLDSNTFLADECVCDGKKYIYFKYKFQSSSDSVLNTFILHWAVKLQIMITIIVIMIIVIIIVVIITIMRVVKNG